MQRHGRRTGAGPLVFALALALAVPVAAFGLLRGVAPDGAAPLATRTPTPTASRTPPRLVFDPPPGGRQTARRLAVRFTSTEPLEAVSLSVLPEPGVACGVTLEGPTRGLVSCDALLAGATDYRLRFGLTSAAGTTESSYEFRTMADRLEDVRWFTEFEDPTGDPAACAAASCRIVQFFTAGADPMTAQQILTFGRQFNRSNDPGLDPAAIAEVLRRLDARNVYHYYVLEAREDATAAAVYWLLRSGKPVIAITLAGQHAPLVIGYRGPPARTYADLRGRVEGVIVMDPQRGDLDPRTASRRPDMYRSSEFQTGRLLGMEEWYGNEWWLRFPYFASIQYQGRTIDIERNDGAYPLPHWGGKFVILVDDRDAEWPSDRQGRVEFR